MGQSLSHTDPISCWRNGTWEKWPPIYFRRWPLRINTLTLQQQALQSRVSVASCIALCQSSSLSSLFLSATSRLGPLPCCACKCRAGKVLVVPNYRPHCSISQGHTSLSINQYLDQDLSYLNGHVSYLEILVKRQF